MDSTILVRETVRGSKLEPVFQKKRGRILDESEHTLTILPEGKKKSTKWSKRDIAKSYTLQPETQEVQKPAKKKLRKGDISNYSPPINDVEEEEVSDMEMSSSHKRVETESCASSEITPISTNLNSETKEDSPAEESSQTEMTENTREPTADKASTSKKVATPEKQSKAVKTPQKENLAKPRVSRIRQATQRYGVDVVMTISNEADE